MKRKKKSHSGKKADNQLRHFKSRLVERYGIYASEADIGRAVASIGAGTAEFYDKDSNRVSIYYVTMQEQRVLVAFDKMRKTFCTALPMPINKEREK